jgi:hypothetical protein
MYSLNPALTEMLANERQADLRRQTAGPRRPSPPSGRVRSLRKATGWALVELGLRLAVPRRSREGRRVVARQHTAVQVAP